MQLTGVLRVMVGERLAVQFARGHEGELQARVRGDQLDQFGAGVAAGTDDAQGVSRIVHA